MNGLTIFFPLRKKPKLNKKAPRKSGALHGAVQQSTAPKNSI